jgi:hypothetical protein
MARTGEVCSGGVHIGSRFSRPRAQTWATLRGRFEPKHSLLLPEPLVVLHQFRTQHSFVTFGGELPPKKACNNDTVSKKGSCVNAA